MTSGARPTIVTPEGVAIDLPIAGPATRIIARLLDLAVVFGILTTVLALVSSSIDPIDGGGASAVIVLSIAVFAAIFVYPVVLESFWQGRTIGKAVLGLRVISDDGAPIGFRHAAVRSVLGFIDVWATVGAVAVISVFVSTRYQRLGDMAAGTLVVRVPDGQADKPVRFQEPRQLAAFAESLPVHRLTNDDYLIVRDTILNVASLRDNARALISDGLAERLERRLDQPRPPAIRVDDYLVCVAARYQTVMGAGPLSGGSGMGAGPLSGGTGMGAGPLSGGTGMGAGPLSGGTGMGAGPLSGGSGTAGRSSSPGGSPSGGLAPAGPPTLGTDSAFAPFSDDLTPRSPDLISDDMTPSGPVSDDLTPKSPDLISSPDSSIDASHESSGDEEGPDEGTGFVVPG